jgi:hypothetical protein
MSDIDITDLLERITGCINNAEYDDEADTLSDAFTVIEAQAAEIERLREIVAIMHTAFAAYADSPAKQEAITLAGKAEQ